MNLAAEIGRPDPPAMEAYDSTALIRSMWYA